MSRPWQSAYAGLLPDSMLAGMSDVRQAAWWTRLLADPGEARGVFVADDQDMGVVGFGSCGLVRDKPEGLDGREIRVGEVYTLYVEPDFQNMGLGGGCSTRCSASCGPTAATTAVAVDAGGQSVAPSL